MPAYNTYLPQYGYQSPYYMPQYQPQQAIQPQAMQQAQMPQMSGTSQTSVQAQAAPAVAANPSTIIWVNGEKEAAMFPVSANSAVALWDSGNPVIFLKKADATGHPSMQIFDLVERVEKVSEPQAVPQVDLSAYAAKSDIAALAGVVDAMRGDIDSIKDELANLASQAVKRAVGAKAKKGEDEE